MSSTSSCSPSRASAAVMRSPLLYGVGLSAMIAVGLLLRHRAATEPIDPQQLISQARAAMRQHDYSRVEQLASAIPRENRLWSAGRLLAGEAAYRSGRPQQAIEAYRAIPRDDTPSAVLAAFSLGEVDRDLGRLSDAEDAYRYVLEQTPDDANVHRRLAFVLGVSGRRWESRPHLLFLVKSRSWTLEDLALLGDLERRMEQREYLEKGSQNAPDDLNVKQGLAQLAWVEGQPEKTRKLLEEVVDQAPEMLAAQALLGEILVDADESQFRRWHARLPTDADRHPDIWYVRGLWARRLGQLEVAARCLWETVSRVPFHRRGNYLLGQVLAGLEDPAHEDFTKRAADLSELGVALDKILKSKAQDEDKMRRAAELTAGMGRVWEAGAWSITAQQNFPFAKWPQEILERVGPSLRQDPPQMLDADNLALRHDLSHYPDHRRLLSSPVSEEGIEPQTLEASVPDSGAEIRFEEEQGVGLDFEYYNAPDPSTAGARMLEQSGGGVAVLDADQDGHPDLYFTQGAHWTHGARRADVSPDRIDRLFRNLAGRSFVDVSAEARLGNQEFGQGTSAGDYNNDGFADLYVADVGPNRLYLNNGDGTFSEVTQTCGIGGDQWTTSCVIVDLNADGNPDLFDVNYVSGPTVYEILCDGKACGPQTFDGTLDRLYVSRGDGTFEEVPVEMPARSAKGLGVIVVDLEGRGRPSLYIANDQEPNFLLKNSPSDDWPGVRLHDEGFLCGLAFNDDGLPLGSMGMAADDLNGDGRIDIFVTNFADEYNNLYLQDAPGLFVDRANVAGLQAPSFSNVGWGTQFLDADRDGEMDLVVTNGHIDDYRDEGREYQMPTQFYHNAGQGRFVELPAERCGSYFGRKHLGRSLARLDWNDDGLMDFVVSNIGQPVSLMTNRTRKAGHFLNVRLHATASARDAIGAVVDMVTPQRQWSKQLVAGDGYLASNQRLLQFGLGSAETVLELRVTWPSGNVSTLRDLPVDTTWQIVEGQRVIRSDAVTSSPASP